MTRGERSLAARTRSMLTGRAVPPRPQSGFTLLEVLLSMAIAALLLLPVGLWMIMAMQQQGPTSDRFSDAAQARIANTYLSRDVGSAELVKVDDFNGNGTTEADGDTDDQVGAGCGTDAGDVVFLQLVDAVDDGTEVPVRTVYVANNDSEGVASVFRRTCLTTATTTVVDQVRVLKGVEMDAGQAPAAACNNDCRQVTFTAVLATGAPVNVRAMHRADLDSAEYLSNGSNFRPSAKADIVSQSGSRPNFTVELTSNRSSDLDGTIVARSWSVDPVATLNEHADGTATAIFADPGLYTVTLTVTDDAGNQSVPVTLDIQVDNQAPNPVIQVIDGRVGPVEGPNQHQFKFDASTTTDSDGDGISQWSWNFGDGTNVVTDPATATPTVVFGADASLGYREVILTVTDGLGKTAVDRTVIQLFGPDGQPPAGGPISVLTDGEPLSQLVNTPDRSPRAGTVGPGRSPVHVTFSTDTPAPYKWELRRGANVVDTSTDANLAHTFVDGDAGDWTISVTPDGGTPETKVFRLNGAPVADFAVNGSGLAPTPRTFDSSASSDDGSIISYSWNFGFFNNWVSSASSPTWPFSHPGAYSVELTVTDDDWISTTETVQISVPGTLVAPQAGAFEGNVYKWAAVPGAEEYQVHLAASGDASCPGPSDVTVPIGEAPSFTTAYPGCSVTASHRVQVSGTWGPFSPVVARQ